MKLNDRTPKRLGYRTPAQVFLGEYLGALNTAGAALIAWIQIDKFWDAFGKCATSPSMGFLACGWLGGCESKI